MSEEKNSKFIVWVKRRRRLIIGIGTILLLIFMMFFIDFMQFIQNLISVGFFGLLIFVITYTIAFILRAYKLKLIFKGLNLNIKYSTSYFSTGASFVINDLTPGKLGDLAKIFMIKDEENIKLSESVAAIAIERILDLILLFIISCFALIYLYISNFSGAPSEQILGQNIQFYLMIGAILIIGILVGLILLLYKTEFIINILKKISPKLALYVGRFVINFKEGMKKFTDHKRELIYIILLGFPTLIIDASIVIIFFYVLGFQLNVFLMILAIILTFFSKTFPITPGGWGISENVGAAFIYFFYSLTITFPEILSIFIIDHLFRSAYLLFFGGYSIFHYNFSLKKIKAFNN
ncbi:MAG: lysylphosphatidylglycerol synthase transmembrane domain-containing protein [Promethearchaeota archaeon]